MGFKSDVFEINPAATGSRVIRADTVTGKMMFEDTSAPSGVSLTDIAGISASEVYVVAASGAGAKYTSLTDAMVAVRASSGTSHLIIVLPGEYSEAGTVTLDRDNIFVWSPGGASVANAVSVPVFTIQAGVTETPSRVHIQGLRISSTAAGIPGVSILGGNGSTLGLKSIILQDCDWVTAGTAMAVTATEVNHVRIIGGSMHECLGGGVKVQATTCSSFVMTGVQDGPIVQLDYTDAGNEPSDSASPKYFVENSNLTSLNSTLTNKGELAIYACGGSFPVVLRGTQMGRFSGSCLGAVEVRDTSKALFGGTSYSSLANDVGVTVHEPVLTGTGILAAGDTTVTVSFPYNQPDTDYMVGISMTDTPLVASGVTTKGTASFIMEVPTSDVNPRGFDWTVSRVLHG